MTTSEACALAEEWIAWVTWCDRLVVEGPEPLEPLTPLTGGNSVEAANLMATTLLAYLPVIEAAEMVARFPIGSQVHHEKCCELRDTVRKLLAERSPADE